MILVFRAFAGIALCAKRLKIIDTVTATLINRNDMIFDEFGLSLTTSNAFVATNYDQSSPFFSTMRALFAGF